jgi:hypothetical protein
MSILAVILLSLAGFVACLVLTPVLLLRHWKKQGDRLLAEEAERWRAEERAKLGLPKHVPSIAELRAKYGITENGGAYTAGALGSALGALAGLALWNRWR